MAETHTTSSGKRLRLFGGGQRNRVPASITALDIDGDLLRVAVGTRRTDGVEFTRVAVAPLPFGKDSDRSDAAQVGEAIRKALEGLRLKPGTVAMGVPRREAILRTVSLPALDDLRELASMVQLQVGRDLPYRKEDAVIDFDVRAGAPQSAPSTPASADAPAVPATPQVEALVGIAQTNVVKFYQDVCAAAGLKLSALTFVPYANVRCLEACGLALADATVAVVSLRKEEMTVDVVQGGKLRFSRDAVLADEHAEHNDATTESAKEDAQPSGAPAKEQLSLVDRITIEVVRSLHAFGGMVPGAAVSRIVVAGGTGHEAEVADVLSSRFALPAAGLDLATALKVNSSEREAAAGAMAPMGIVLAGTEPDGLAFDFVSPKRPAVQRNMRRIRMLAAAATLVVLFVVVAGVRSYLVKKRLKIQQGIQQEIAGIQKGQPIYRKTRAQAAGIQEWLKDGRNWLEHYAYLSSILPGSEEIYITSLTIGSQGTIRLAVQARNGEVLAKLDKQLRDAGYEVRPQAINPGADRYGYETRSSVELIVPPKMKIDLAKTKTPPARPADDVSLNPPGKSGAGKAPAPAISVYGGGSQ